MGDTQILTNPATVQMTGSFSITAEFERIKVIATIGTLDPNVELVLKSGSKNWSVGSEELFYGDNIEGTCTSSSVDYLPDEISVNGIVIATNTDDLESFVFTVENIIDAVEIVATVKQIP